MKIPPKTSSNDSSRHRRTDWRMPEPARLEAIRHLTGTGSGGQLPKAITAPGRGGKFDEDGNVQPFPGNTFICHIDQSSQLYDALCAYQDGLKETMIADHYTFLPKPSFHMTVFCGVSGDPLGEDGWPEGMERTSSLNEITKKFSERFPRKDNSPGIDVTASGISKPGTVTMQPASPAGQSKLSKARHRLQKLTGLYRSDIDTYEFHISLGYLRRWFDQDTAEEAYKTAERLFAHYLRDRGAHTLGAIELCTFETMHHFEPVVFRPMGG